MTSRLWLKAALAAGVALCLCGDASAQGRRGAQQPVSPFVGITPPRTPPLVNAPGGGRPGGGNVGGGQVWNNLTPQQQAVVKAIILRRLAQQQQAATQQQAMMRRAGR